MDIAMEKIAMEEIAMEVKLLSKYNCEFLIDVIRLEFRKGLLNSFLNLKYWSAT